MNGMTIQEIFGSYCKLSTRKREVMSPPTVKRLGLYWHKYINSSYSVSYAGFREWLASLNLHPNSKKSICHSVGKMMYTYELLTLSEFDRLKSMFNARQSNWSKKVIPEEELYKFFKTIVSRDVAHFYIYRDVVIFITMLITGIRVGQLLELYIDDITLLEEHIQFKISTSKKNDMGYNYEDKYIIKVPNDAGFDNVKIGELIREYLGCRQRNVGGVSPHFICDINGNKMGDENIRVMCKKFSPNYKLSPHSFRHTAISKVALQFGITKAAILANHTSINTTKKYVQVQVGDMDEIYRKSSD